MFWFALVLGQAQSSSITSSAILRTMPRMTKMVFGSSINCGLLTKKMTAGSYQQPHVYSISLKIGSLQSRICVIEPRGRIVRRGKWRWRRPLEPSPALRPPPYVLGALTFHTAKEKPVARCCIFPSAIECYFVFDSFIATKTKVIHLLC